jgi:hypothetical protein
MTPLPTWAYEGVVAPLALGLALHQAWRALGPARALGELLALAVYGYALERAAIAVFRSHDYGQSWASAPGGVPLAVAGVWAAVLAAAMAVASQQREWGPLRRAAVAALLGISLDLLMEPVAVRRGLWRWTPPGAWLGVPMGNFVGWGVIVGVYAFGAERWAGASGVLGEAGRRAGLAAAAVAALMAVGAAWRTLGLETLFDARVSWGAWGALLLATVVATTAPGARPVPAGTGDARPRRVRVGPSAVFLLLAAAFAWDALALADRNLTVAAVGTLATLAWATRPVETAARLLRWRRSAHLRFARVEGFVVVLMKPRNGIPWTPADRQFLREALLQLVRWSPALVVFLLPGGMLLLAGYAWLLDRRGRARDETPAPEPTRAT